MKQNQRFDLVYQEILTFGSIEIKKQTTVISLLFFLGNTDIEKVLVTNKIPFGEKTISTLLVTCLMVIMLNH